MMRRLRWRAAARRRPAASGRAAGWLVRLPLFGGLLGVLLAVAVINVVEARLTPVLETMAAARVEKAAIQVMDDIITEVLADKNILYSDLIAMERDGGGRVAALSSDMTALNGLRTSIVNAALREIPDIDYQQLAVPVGNLTGINLFSGRGAPLPVEIVSVSVPHAEYESLFSEAGINQTRHQIVLRVSVAVDVLLPGGGMCVNVSTSMPVAETVIVGTVPDTYLNLTPG